MIYWGNSMRIDTEYLKDQKIVMGSGYAEFEVGKGIIFKDNTPQYVLEAYERLVYASKHKLNCA